MRKTLIRIMLFMMVALTMAACGAKGADKLIGKWAVDLDKTAEFDDVKGLPEDQRKAAADVLKNIAGSLSFEFTKDKLVIDNLGIKKEGAWSVKYESGDKMTVEYAAVENGAATTKKMDFEFRADGVTVVADQQRFALKKK